MRSHSLKAALHELSKFGLVGAAAAVVDLGGAEFLHERAGLGALTAKALSVTAASVVAYAGNRLWTFRHRVSSGLARSFLLFFLLNGIALLVAELVIGFVSYPLGMTSRLDYAVANVTGTALGTVFRYMTYKKWVFLPQEPEVTVPGAGTKPVTVLPPWERQHAGQEGGNHVQDQGAIEADPAA